MSIPGYSKHTDHLSNRTQWYPSMSEYIQRPVDCLRKKGSAIFSDKDFLRIFLLFLYTVEWLFRVVFGKRENLKPNSVVNIAEPYHYRVYIDRQHIYVVRIFHPILSYSFVVIVSVVHFCSWQILPRVRQSLFPL